MLHLNPFLPQKISYSLYRLAICTAWPGSSRVNTNVYTNFVTISWFHIYIILRYTPVMLETKDKRFYYWILIWFFPVSDKNKFILLNWKFTLLFKLIENLNSLVSTINVYPIIKMREFCKSSLEIFLRILCLPVVQFLIS